MVVFEWNLNCNYDKANPNHSAEAGLHVTIITKVEGEGAIIY